MPPKFGTSGLRGLVTDLTDPLCAGYTFAFLRGAETNGTVLIGRDMRASSPRMAAAVASGAARLGLRALDCGVLPTPALALLATARGTAAVMVTGSHIPDDRNGLKFYTRHGEITKDDEAAITAGVAELDLTAAVDTAELVPETAALSAFTDRYTSFFPSDYLAQMRIGFYEHSSAARACLGAILTGLGADCISLGPSDRFIPVDTEAVDPSTQDMLAGWARDHRLDAIVSTDGDADRPMLADAQGQIIPGDRLGPLTALAIGATDLVTPVSSNTLVDAMGSFTVHRTRIGSPHVIAGMQAARTAGAKAVAGYEANGGFLTGFTASRDGRSLPPLLTRDSVLPLIAPLGLARDRGLTLAALNATLPARFTATDRLVGVETDASARLIRSIDDDGPARTELFEGLGTVAAVDRTDGFRATLADGRIAHLRPSGNAPECRVYAEAESPEAAHALQSEVMSRVARMLDGGAR